MCPNIHEKILFCLVFSIFGIVTGQQCKHLSFERLCVTDDDIVVLENEMLSMTINKSMGQITSLYYNSQIDEDIKQTNLLKSGQGYYLGHASLNDTALKMAPDVDNMIITQKAEIIDLAFINKKNAYWPIHFEFHLVLEKNSSLFYYYSIHKYLDDNPDGYSADELRWAIRANKWPFKYYSVDGNRMGAMPTQKDIDEAQRVQDWTYKLKDGTVYSKYQQISANENINSVFGLYGDHIGFSLLQTSKEWLSGGPFKQDLTTHTGQMLLFHEHSRHYGTPALVPWKGWTKVYGPVGFYLNEGTGLGDLYADAHRQLKEEESKWPYRFVTAPEYAANGRGSVSGILHVDGVANKEWSYLILTEPHVDDPQYETLTYMYSANAAEDGEFIIPAVRPGTYKLQVIAKGVSGKYVQNNIHVDANNNTDLGTINWQQESHGQLLWQIGIPDRSSSEFRVPPGFPSPIPNLEEYRKFGTWLSYSKVFPNDIDFTVGKSNPAKDWCYFMPMIKTPGFPAQLKLFGIEPNTTGTNWKVRFDYDGNGKGNATLTLGLAADVRAGLRVVINSHEIFKIAYLDSYGPADSALFRQAAHGIFRQLQVNFSASLLKAQNVLEFTPAGQLISDDHFDNNLMWDFLRMEVASRSNYMNRGAPLMALVFGLSTLFSLSRILFENNL